MSAKVQAVRDPLTEASAWRIALTEHNQRTTPEFERWLGEDPAHAQAWSHVQSSWDIVGELGQTDELSDMRRNALVRAADERRSRRQPLWASIAACLLVIVAAMTVREIIQWRASEPTLYETALGERRVVTLGDQSKVTLDSNSEVEALYTDDARKLVLLKGQARFDVAHDPLRPFTVQALDKIVVATGTAFTVDLLDKNVFVTLIEGKVTVLKTGSSRQIARSDDHSPRRPEASLVAGQQLVSSLGDSAAVVQPANIEKSTSWEQGLLMFDNEPLASVAARVSRYSDRQIIVDPSVADLRMSGVFSAGDVDTFVDAVSRYLPVTAKHRPDGVELAKRA